MRLIRWAATFALIACSAALPRAASAEPQLRLGVTDDPDTLFVGFGFESPLSRMQSGYIVITPKLDVGFGDDVDFFTIRGSADFEFLFSVGGRGTYVYPLVGMSLYYLNVNDCGGSDCDDTGVGVDVGFGVKFSRFAFEVVAGIEEIPDATIAFSIGL